MWFFLIVGTDASEIRENCVPGLKRGCYTHCRACHSRKQMSAIKDSRNVEKNSGAVQKCCEPLSLVFLREPFQEIQCSQREAANCALDLAKPRVSQLLSAWRRLDGGMAPPRASVHHILSEGADAALWGNFSPPNTELVWMRCAELLWGATGGPFWFLSFKHWILVGFK